MTTRRVASWSVRAVNLPEHADNPVHTDDGAVAAGFPRAIVAGTTVYAYLTRPAVDAWGPDWMAEGGGEVRFQHPVFADDVVSCDFDGDDRTATITARVDGDVRATFAAERAAASREFGPGTKLGRMEVDLDDQLCHYGVRVGDDHPLHGRDIAHPAIWPIIGNRVMLRHLVSGPWVHVRSRIVHHAPAPTGTVAAVEARIVDRSIRRSGTWYTVDVAVSIDGRRCATVEHEAIIELAPSVGGG